MSEVSASEGRSGRVRQFRVTVTEDPQSTVLRVSLSWRTFPCAATKWDGVFSASVSSSGAPIQSQAALRAVLRDLAVAEWDEGVRYRR